MKPLFVLSTVFAISLFGIFLYKHSFEFTLSGRIAMSAMLLFTAIAHFVFTQGMTMMLPTKLPYKTTVIYGTGVLEILFAIGLLFPSVQTITAWLLIGFFVALLPANIFAALKHVDYQKGTFAGSGPSYLWFRVPLQIFFIIWAYLSCIHHSM